MELSRVGSLVYHRIHSRGLARTLCTFSRDLDVYIDVLLVEPVYVALGYLTEQFVNVNMDSLQAKSFLV